MEENTYVGITLIRVFFYVTDTYRQVLMKI
jgi:hypothetical protein